ncbi:MAG: SPFH domain-containing protein [Candidatus Pacebacteria bacterium]|nr:SPFH domain-containing protein [Candidatus Paceibacterota bacterium]
MTTVLFGLALVALFLLSYLEYRTGFIGNLPWGRIGTVVLYIVLIIVGLVLVCAYLYVRFDKDQETVEFKEKWIGTIDYALIICAGLLGVWKIYKIFQYNWVTGLIIIVCLAIFAMVFLVIIPTAHYAVHTRLGKRTGRTSKEGLAFRIPILEDYMLFPSSLMTFELHGENSVKVVTQDGVTVTIECSAQGRPSYKHLVRFVEIPEETITLGLIDAVEQDLGIIAGQMPVNDFVSKRGAITLMINCIFLMGRRPEDLATDREFSHLPWDNTVAGIEFYVRNANIIKAILKEDKTTSPVENLYCLDIDAVKVAKITYSKEMQEDMEKTERAKLRRKAALELHKDRMTMMNELIEAGVSPDQASDDSAAALGISEKKIWKGAMPFNNANQ